MPLADRDEFQLVAKHLGLLLGTVPKSLFMLELFEWVVDEISDARRRGSHAAVDAKMGESAEDRIWCIADCFGDSFDAFSGA